MARAGERLVVHRATLDQTDRMPLLLEETRLGAEAAGLSYDIDAREIAARTRRTDPAR